MKRINKGNRFKIILAIMAIALLCTNAAYAIFCLRVPSDNSNEYKRLKERTQAVFNKRYKTGVQEFEQKDGSVKERQWFRPGLFVYDEINAASANRNLSELMVVNLGCGDGLKGGAIGSTWLVKKGFKSIQVDFAEEGIKVFQGLLSETELARTEFIASDYIVALEKILRDEGKNSSDLFVAHLALNWLNIEETEYVFRLIEDIFKPGGRFVFKVLSTDEKDLNEARIGGVAAPIGWQKISGEGEFY